MNKLGWLMSLTSAVTSPPSEGEPAGTSTCDLENHNEEMKMATVILITVKKRKRMAVTLIAIDHAD